MISETGIPFSGDILYDRELIKGDTPQEQAEYHRSMPRLYHMPVCVVHGGHSPNHSSAGHSRIIRDWLDSKETAA